MESRIRLVTQVEVSAVIVVCVKTGRQTFAREQKALSLSVKRMRQTVWMVVIEWMTVERWWVSECWVSGKR